MPDGVVIRWWAACASFGAGLIHLAVVDEHASEWWLYGVFFLVLGIVQIAWAAEAVEAGPLPVPRLYAAMNAAVVGLWLITRTTGLPVGPEPWEAEAVAASDLVCSVLEVVVVALLVVTVSQPTVQQAAAPTKKQRRLITVGVLVTAVVTLGALVANPPTFGHSHQPHSADSALR